MKYEIGQTLLVPAKVVAVGDIDKSEDQHLTIQFPNGAQITNYPSQDVSEILAQESQEQKEILEPEKKEEPPLGDPAETNPTEV